MPDLIPRLSAALADRYRVERELGAGGMATVYLAEDLKHKRRVAIKVLRPELAAVIGAERFLHEITTTANLQHPHILPLHDSGEVAGSVFYVMPYVEGESLRDRIAREKQLPIAEAVRIASEVAGALDYAHRHGVIHRDIKPENILLHDGRALVADFGIALAASSAGSRMTETGMSLGTPTYMSPEQAMGERNLDARTDVYALGCVLYEMLTGDAPFTGSTAQAIVAKVISEKPVPPTRLRDTVPDEVEDAVLVALQKLPADRFTSAADFAAALQGGGSGTGAATSATRRRLAARAPQPSPLGRVAWPIALAAMAIAGAWGWLRPASRGAAPPVIRYRVALDSISESMYAYGHLAISPDGELLAHSSGQDDRLRVRRRDAVGFSGLAGTDGARAPFFSPDGKSIGYLVGTRLMVKPVSGGPAEQYADSLIAAAAPVWGDDGYIYGLWKTFDSNESPIWRMRAGPGAALEPATRVDAAGGELSHALPEVLPDGRGLLFTIEHKERGYLIGVAGPDGGAHRVLTPGVRARYDGSGRLLYSTVDGNLWSVGLDLNTLTLTGEPSLVADHLRSGLFGPVDFVVSRSGTLAYSHVDAGDLRELVWVARDGRVEPVDTAWQAGFGGPAISPDGSRLAVAIQEQVEADIWIRELRTGRHTRLTFGRAFHQGASWSLDSRAVTYLQGTGGAGDVWSRRIDGNEAAVRLIESARPVSEAFWAPRGGWLVGRTTTGAVGSGDIIAIRPNADSALTPVRDSPLSEYSPTLSPDGKWMAYTSNETGRFEVYVVPFPAPGTARWQVSSEGGLMPRWSRGGGEIFFIDPASNMVAAEVSRGATFGVVRSRVLFSTVGFINGTLSRRNYDVAPGDQRFLMVRSAGGASSAHLTVVENWGRK